MPGEAAWPNTAGLPRVLDEPKDGVEVLPNAVWPKAGALEAPVAVPELKPVVVHDGLTDPIGEEVPKVGVAVLLKADWVEETPRLGFEKGLAVVVAVIGDGAET